MWLDGLKIWADLRTPINLKIEITQSINHLDLLTNSLVSAPQVTALRYDDLRLG